jgi:hypothetical protein
MRFLDAVFAWLILDDLFDDDAEPLSHQKATPMVQEEDHECEDEGWDDTEG